MKSRTIALTVLVLASLIGLSTMRAQTDKNQAVASSTCQWLVTPIINPGKADGFAYIHNTCTGEVFQLWGNSKVKMETK